MVYQVKFKKFGGLQYIARNVLKIPFQWCITSCTQNFKIVVVKPKKKNPQSFNDCSSGWSKEPQWENDCDSFFTMFSTNEVNYSDIQNAFMLDEREVCL
jgi:hypothetical protein